MKFDRVIAVKNNKIIFKDGNRAVKTFSGSGKKEEDEANPNTGAPVLG